MSKIGDLFKVGGKLGTWKAKLGIGLGILIALAIALFATYSIGLNKGKNISQVEITKYEGKIQTLEGQLAKAQARVTTEVVTKYVRDVAYQDRIVYVNRDIIKTVIENRPFEQTVSKGYIYAHNQSALGKPIDATLANNDNASGIQDGVVLDTVAGNYGICRVNMTQLKALQEWTQRVYDESKKVANEAARNSN
jgi:hypothetical protein